MRALRRASPAARGSGRLQFKKKSNSDPIIPVGAVKGQTVPRVWLRNGPAWVRVSLQSVVGHFLSRKGTLSLQFCATRPTYDDSQILVRSSPSYAEASVCERVTMDGKGMQGHGQHQAGFNNQQQGS
jgi:hypothetical protein